MDVSNDICIFCRVRRLDSSSTICPQAVEWQMGDEHPHEWETYYGPETTDITWKRDKSEKQGEKQLGEAPSRYDEARSWGELRPLIAPFAVLKFRSVSLTPCCFSNFETIDRLPGVCDVFVQGSKRASELWTRCRSRVIGNITEHKSLFLTHTGIMYAEVTTTSKKWIFCGSAANVCINGSDRVVHLFNGKNEEGVKGSCHTEQLCMYWLQDELERLARDEKLVHIKLFWYTEKPMCELWCVPALMLFVAHWRRLDVSVESNSF